MTVQLVAVRKIGGELEDTHLMFDYTVGVTDLLENADVKSVLLVPMMDGVPVLVDRGEFKSSWEKFEPSESECHLFDMLYPEAKYKLSNYRRSAGIE